MHVEKNSSPIPKGIDVPDVYRNRAGTHPPSYSGCTRLITTRDGRKVPCHTCFACQRARASHKTAALNRELEHTPFPSYFLCLTYNETSHARLAVPSTVDGELSAIQKIGERNIRKKIQKAADKKRRLPATTMNALDRVLADEQREYQENQLKRFLELAQPAAEQTYSLDVSEVTAWTKRIKRLLEERGLPPKLPRMVVKTEYGDRTHRVHHHVIALGPSAIQLDCMIRAWGHLFLRPDQQKAKKLGVYDPCVPTWHQLVSIDDIRGHVDVVPVTDKQVSSYVCRDMYRGQSYKDMVYLAKSQRPPVIRWPREPALGAGFWPGYLQEQWRQMHKRGDSATAIELAIQNTRDKRHSLRHVRLEGRAAGTADKTGLPRREAEKVYERCPPATWMKFLKDIDSERDPVEREHVKAKLSERDKEEARCPIRSEEQKRRSLRVDMLALENWRRVKGAKGLELPSDALDQLAQYRESQSVSAGENVVEAEHP